MYLFIVLGLSDVLLFVIRLKSELQARAKVKAVTLDAVTDVEVVDPARAKIEVTLTQLRGVGNNGADAESPPNKTIERGRCAFVVVDLLDPAFDKAYAESRS